MKLSEDDGAADGVKKRDRWPKEVTVDSVTVTIYRVWRENLARFVFNVVYYRGGERKIDQRGKESVAMEHARFMAGLLASGKTTADDVQQRDVDELNEARRLTGKVPLLLALKEWVKARELVGEEVIQAAGAWKRRQTKFERVSVFEAVARFRAKKGKKNNHGVVRLSNSYEAVFKHFLAKFAERYMDDLKAAELEAFILEPENMWTQGTRQKRLRTLFTWCIKKELLPRDLVTEADRTENIEEPAPSRPVIEPAFLKRLLVLLQFGGDLENPDKIFEPRTEFVPALALATFLGLRSCEVDVQVWEDIDFEDRQLNVTMAKEGTAADRAIDLHPCVVEWLKLTPPDERVGLIHPYLTEVCTMLRKYLKEKAGIHIPKNTFRKSWISYSLKADKNMSAVTAEAGHTSSIEIKHYRNARAKKKHAAQWFVLTPSSIGHPVPGDAKNLTKKRLAELTAEQKIMARYAARCAKAS